MVGVGTSLHPESPVKQGDVLADKYEVERTLAGSRAGKRTRAGDGDSCQPGAFEDRTDARKAGNVSTAFFAGGLALAVTGVVLVIVGGPADRESSAFVTPLRGGASAGFRAAF